MGEGWVVRGLGGCGERERGLGSFVVVDRRESL